MNRQKRKASTGDPAPGQQKAKTVTGSKAQEDGGEEPIKDQERPKPRRISKKVPSKPSKSDEGSDMGEGTSNTDK